MPAPTLLEELPLLPGLGSLEGIVLSPHRCCLRGGVPVQPGDSQLVAWEHLRHIACAGEEQLL